MLAHLVALGVFSAAASGGGPITDVGEAIATTERTAFVLVVQSDAVVAPGLPLGAVAWQQQFDPADHAPYALDFTALLDTGEKIAAIDAITMNATAALLGVGVDEETGFSPIIDQDGKKVQLWFIVDEESWLETGFSASGVVLPVTIRVTTNSTPAKRYERSGVLRMRQL